VHLVEIEPPICGPSHGQVAVVYGVERSAEQRDAARMMFCGSAMRLRGGQ
jgi:hypothetical protein